MTAQRVVTAGAEAVTIDPGTAVRVSLTGGPRTGYQAKGLDMADGYVRGGGTFALNVAAAWTANPPAADSLRLFATVEGTAPEVEGYIVCDSGASGQANPVTAAGLAMVPPAGLIGVYVQNLTADPITVDFVDLNVYRVP